MIRDLRYFASLLDYTSRVGVEAGARSMDTRCLIDSLTVVSLVDPDLEVGTSVNDLLNILADNPISIATLMLHETSLRGTGLVISQEDTGGLLSSLSASDTLSLIVTIVRPSCPHRACDICTFRIIISSISAIFSLI